MGVLFTKDKTVATDSFRLLEITTPSGMKPEDFPIVSDATALKECQPFIVPAKSLREIKIPKSKTLPIMENVAIKKLDKEQVEFLTTDLETAKITTARIINGKFPDYEKIFPCDKPIAEILVNGKFLSELLTIMAKLNNLQQEVKIKIYGKDKPMVLEASNKNQKARGMLMPIKK
ncbi:MAG: hypothetical protein Athens071426_409 [Parcubacteria group bacterium Athens0714_26]|nr:MAG: hypothetical protein Athens071426_409 [Parcubacteria group bacterium Athens0714_26]